MKKNKIEIIIKNSQNNTYINYKACEEAEEYITETFNIPKEIFLTMQIHHKNTIITIINPSTLPIHFKWDNIFEVD